MEHFNPHFQANSQGLSFWDSVDETLRNAGGTVKNTLEDLGHLYSVAGWAIPLIIGAITLAASRQ